MENYNIDRLTAMKDKDTEHRSEIGEHQRTPSVGEIEQRNNRILEFFSDFITGFGALFVLGIILFVIVPLGMVVLKVGVAFAVPVAILGACIILIALFGRFIKFLIKKW